MCECCVTVYFCELRWTTVRRWAAQSALCSFTESFGRYSVPTLTYSACTHIGPVWAEWPQNWVTNCVDSICIPSGIAVLRYLQSFVCVSMVVQEHWKDSLSRQWHRPLQHLHSAPSGFLWRVWGCGDISNSGPKSKIFFCVEHSYKVHCLYRCYLAVSSLVIFLFLWSAFCAFKWRNKPQALDWTLHCQNWVF